MTAKCLTCVYQPDWTDWTGGEYPRQNGKCKFPMPYIKLPYGCSIGNAPHIQRYSDDSGIPSRCPTYKELNNA